MGWASSTIASFWTEATHAAVVASAGTYKVEGGGDVRVTEEENK